MKHPNKGSLLKRLPDLLLEAAGWLAGWAAGGVVDSFCDTELGVRLLFDMVEWPGGGLVEQCSLQSIASRLHQFSSVGCVLGIYYAKL